MNTIAVEKGKQYLLFLTRWVLAFLVAYAPLILVAFKYDVM